MNTATRTTALSIRHIVLTAILLLIGALLSTTAALAGTGDTMDHSKMDHSKMHHSSMISRSEVLGLIQYDKGHELSDAQEAIRVAGLEGIPAPCCDEYSAATCCCPCNLAKALWGLSKQLIIEEGANAKIVHDRAQDWLARISKEEFTGDACFDGGCGRSMRHNGCGGMEDNDIKT